MTSDTWSAAELGPPVVDADWLAEHVPEVVVVDARWYLDGRSGRAAYESGHIPGAVWVDLERVLADQPSSARGRHPLPDPERFASGLGELGIGADVHVVAYDDASAAAGAGGTGAARLVWLLRRIGQRAAVVDGGLAAWTGSLETRTVRRRPVERSARAWPAGLIVDADEAAQAEVLLDARAAERYRGEVEPIDPRAGHIPGARSLPFTASLDADGRFLGAAQLRATFEAAGVRPGDPGPVAYCGSGVTACHVLLALESAGLGPGRLYAGSWSQWSSDPGRPAATG